MTEKTGDDNPFGAVDVGTNSAPNVVDWDQDGEVEVVPSPATHAILMGLKAGESAFQTLLDTM